MGDDPHANGVSLNHIRRVAKSDSQAGLQTLLEELPAAYFLFGEVLNVFQIVAAGLILWSVIMLRPR